MASAFSARNLGQYCLNVNITPERLLSSDLPKLDGVTNGVVNELCAFVNIKRLQKVSVGHWLQAIGIEHPEIDTCVWNLYDHKQDLRNYKKGKQLLALNESRFDPNE